MVYLNQIYTRSGDDGQTSLGDGSRIAKTHTRVSAMGSVDELNAIIGVVLAECELPQEMTECLTRVQNLLFDLGADLCLPVTNDNEARQPLRIADSVPTWFEEQIDRFNEPLTPLTSFILPGGTSAAAHLHHARAVCRRAEVDVLRLAESDSINPAVTITLNRLSDLLFVMARACNINAGSGDVLWEPGKSD
ncbi:MAG: cob(I)yrinic acid a,c-diamide adenosyltransferase [Planctomycetaceae bacterium]|nr:cob(I)yrinic acid a,c-diamide adenosyltransferase [Planctomycetaceae bacterium]